MFVGKKATNQRTNFLESLRDGLKEQEEGKFDVKIDDWQEKNKQITEREEYVQHMRSKMEDWNNELDALEDKAQNSGPEIREKGQTLIGELDQKLAEGQEVLMNIAGTTDDSWMDLKLNAEVVWENIKNSFEETRKAVS
jgi:predicted  nucleic acid-binding Zn-ribbon protein